ncbi:type II toxin-antitoxin system HipA family toxin (plasmid) [Sulfurimonas aquatica]|uniref:Type II toxin-antitoxin system HipA family toxin n=1 Tax=Sulfurimonas aquatica TaxID=2672570 RepID=A0A975B2U0_9BACT|nr:HipA domain-containing protein [Sulfurimonas aquatica]QSZ43189.1 type II toxin-antitoxin system HipA family toxin [Sulfurimonas aquatica]
MSDKVSVYLFDKHIADVFQVDDRIYLRQFDNGAHLASPISIVKDIADIETTSLIYLDRVAGFISDSLPGSFGEEILDNFFMQNSSGIKPTIIDKLLFIGNRGLGAIEFRPAHIINDNTNTILSLKDIYDEVKKLKRGDDFKSIHDAFLVSAHSFVGGARSKAVASINLESNEVYFGDRTKEPPIGFIPVIIKYDDTQGGDENKSTYSKLEYIYYILAKESGINMNECYLIESNGKHHFITKRFDVEGSKKFHVHSLAGLLHVDYNIPRSLGYEELFRVAVKLNATTSIKQLFLQMLFNYMFVNQDDHARNFSFMCSSDYKWQVTPAYDLTFAKGVKQTKEHQMTLYSKALSQIQLQDIVNVATEFSIDLEFVSSAIETMKNLRENKLRVLMNQYKVSKKKQDQVLQEVMQRDFQGALNE